jgi:hypothetical protein
VKAGTGTIALSEDHGNAPEPVASGASYIDFPRRLAYTIFLCKKEDCRLTIQPEEIESFQYLMKIILTTNLKRSEACGFSFLLSGGMK